MRLVSYSAVSAIGSFLLFTAYAFVTTIENEFLYQFGTFATTLFTFAIGLPMLFITRHYPLSLRLLIYLTAGVFTILLFMITLVRCRLLNQEATSGASFGSRHLPVCFTSSRTNGCISKNVRRIIRRCLLKRPSVKEGLFLQDFPNKRRIM